jgi:hypothetical protein
VNLSEAVKRVLFLSGVLALFVGCGGGGGTSPKPEPPKVTEFSALPIDIAPGDSIRFTYAVTGSDSTVLTPPRQKLTPAGGGSVYVKPVHPTRYWLIAYNADGRDSASVLVPMAASVPLIQTAAFDADTIVQHDSVTLSYSVLRADSVVLTSVGKLSSASSGSIKLSPVSGTTYTLTAYNGVGSDTTAVKVVVEIPHSVTALNGKYYKGSLGSSTLTPSLKFVCTDSTTQMLYKPWIHLSKLTGDGQISTDSLRPDASGKATFTYLFSDTIGQATLRAFVRGFDSTDVSLRADILTPGSHGQGQYVSFDDSYRVVKILNGLPASVDVDPASWLTYANYEAALGVVVMINDLNQNSNADDAESVLGVIVTTKYQGKTKAGIGIGAAYHDVVAAYGAPDSLYYRTADSSYLIMYLSRGLVLWGGASDTSVVQIQVSDGIVQGVASRRMIDSPPSTASVKMKRGYRTLLQP